ncbi:MAG: hypothetical protein JO073_15155 [Actinobacteria bacterium]|nr:hypothetical protein [Actinomycetota bacterium]
MTWTTTAAGIPCTIHAAHDGTWLVTFAATTFSRRTELAQAIVDASGGNVDAEEASLLAAQVMRRMMRRAS